jgi:hypothetical protein
MRLISTSNYSDALGGEAPSKASAVAPAVLTRKDDAKPYSGSDPAEIWSAANLLVSNCSLQEVRE